MQNDLIKDMNCDTEAGICAVNQPLDRPEEPGQNKPLKLLFFTDPICSSCWGIEPQLRKLKQEYGAYFDIEYRMGGLLKSWSEYGGRDVNGPASVAQHWDEAGAYYGMPIDGNVWNEDPLHSSYPPAIAFKAAQLQGVQKSDRFLRRIKEMVFMEKRNITRREHLVQAAKEAGMDAGQFELDFEHKAKRLFEEDLLMAKEWGVRGFPTIYFLDKEDNRLKVYGSKPYHVYEQALLKLVSEEVVKQRPASFETIFNQYDTVTVKEFAVFYETDVENAQNILNQLQEQKKVTQALTHAGSLWRWKPIAETGNEPGLIKQ